MCFGKRLFIGCSFFLLLCVLVNGVANGLQAWKILEDPNNHTDIILTEVVMPVISGIALLCKIMSHKSLKNIPVISKYCLIGQCIHVLFDFKFPLFCV